jgi:hypothetical protein
VTNIPVTAEFISKLSPNDMYTPDYKKIIINHDGGEERHTIVIDDYKATGFSVLTRSKKNFTYKLLTEQILVLVLRGLDSKIRDLRFRVRFLNSGFPVFLSLCLEFGL